MFRNKYHCTVCGLAVCSQNTCSTKDLLAFYPDMKASESIDSTADAEITKHSKFVTCTCTDINKFVPVFVQFFNFFYFILGSELSFTKQDAKAELAIIKVVGVCHNLPF